MKHASRILTLFLLTFALASVAFAQRGMDVNQRVQMLKERLHLDTTQTAKVTEIMNGAMVEMKAVREKNPDDRDAMRAGMREVQQKMDKKIEALLNDDQKKEFAKLREEQLKQMQQRMQQQQQGAKP
jgi:periplasmic protein CpxP/Spy